MIPSSELFRLLEKRLSFVGYPVIETLLAMREPILLLVELAGELNSSITDSLLLTIIPRLNFLSKINGNNDGTNLI